MAFPHPLPKLEPQPFNLGSLEGIRCAGVSAGIKPSGRRDVALLVSEHALEVAGVFTENRYAAAPVLLSREHLAQTGGKARAILVTSGNANACTGERGKEDARLLTEEVAALVGCPRQEVLIAQTGVIGVPLPREAALVGVRAAFAALEPGEAGGRAFLEAIQTTDAFDKEATRAFTTSVGPAKVAGFAKGAGMIEPNMATLLAFVGTDVALGAAALRRHLPEIAAQSFNALHVDTHTSTNDSFFLFSTGKLGAGSDSVAALGAIAEVARRLAWLIARDGEGATKVSTVRVTGATSDAAANVIARRVVTSALVRTALFGNDPNWGRIVSAVGNGPEVVDPAAVRCAIQAVPVFEDGEPLEFDRAALSNAMQAEDLDIALSVGGGPGHAEVMTSDLGYRYVEVNAEYTT